MKRRKIFDEFPTFRLPRRRGWKLRKSEFFFFLISWIFCNEYKHKLLKSLVRWMNNPKFHHVIYGQALDSFYWGLLLLQFCMSHCLMFHDLQINDYDLYHVLFCETHHMNARNFMLKLSIIFISFLVDQNQKRKSRSLLKRLKLSLGSSLSPS